MLTTERKNLLRRRLIDMMVKAKQNPNLRIEYGDPIAPPGAPMSAFRLRWMNTAGGMQWCHKSLSRGMEGSGVYMVDNADFVAHVMECIDHYHRPTAFSSKFKTFLKPTTLDFFIYDVTAAQRSPFNNQMTSVETGLFGKEETITLPDDFNFTTNETQSSTDNTPSRDDPPFESGGGGDFSGGGASSDY